MIKGIFIGILLVIGLLEFGVIGVDDLKKSGTVIKKIISDNALKVHEVTK